MSYVERTITVAIDFRFFLKLMPYLLHKVNLLKKVGLDVISICTDADKVAIIKYH